MQLNLLHYITYHVNTGFNLEPEECEYMDNLEPPEYSFIFEDILQ